MAAPVCFGYIIARANAPAPATGSLMSRRAKLTRMADGRMAWLAVAGAMMIVALLVSMSRSGILSLAAAVGNQRDRSAASCENRWWVAGVFGAGAGAGSARAEIPALAERFVRSRTSVGDRLRIWRDTLPIVRDFWLTGTGGGTYRTAMLYYQRADRVDVQFNQAHNHYLQAAAEGGIVLAGLILAGLLALSATVRERLGSERTGAFWIRAGSACGLLAVALQSLWETGLVMPANAALAAVLAAIACHER